MVFSSTPQGLGLPRSEFATRDALPVTADTVSGKFASRSLAVSKLTFLALKANLSQSIELKCWQDSIEEHMENVNTLSSPRFTPTRCRPWSFLQDEAFTVVAMTPPVGNRGRLNHNDVRFVYLAAEDNSTVKQWPAQNVQLRRIGDFRGRQ